MDWDYAINEAYLGDELINFQIVKNDERGRRFLEVAKENTLNHPNPHYYEKTIYLSEMHTFTDTPRQRRSIV